MTVTLLSSAYRISLKAVLRSQITISHVTVHAIEQVGQIEIGVLERLLEVPEALNSNLGLSDLPAALGLAVVGVDETRGLIY